MIYLTGDTHGELDIGKLTSKYRPEQQGALFQKGDCLIILGDFGFPFTPTEIEQHELFGERGGKYSRRMKWFTEQPYTVLFIDGNHDNHDWWAKQEVSEMFGGRVQIHPHAENVIHLMRGEVYDIEGRSFFTFGGAASVDKNWRIEGLSWWRGEEAQRSEIENALDNLERVGNKVDYILTHTMPMSIIKSIPMFDHKVYPCTTAAFLDEVLNRVEYDKWFCGHFHVDMPVHDKRLFILYDTVTAIDRFDSILEDSE